MKLYWGMQVCHEVVLTCPTMAVARISERYFVLARSAIFNMMAALRRKGGGEEGNRIGREKGRKGRRGRSRKRVTRQTGLEHRLHLMHTLSQTAFSPMSSWPPVHSQLPSELAPEQEKHNKQ